MSASHNLADILDLISSDSVKDRDSGFSSLKPALEFHQRHGKLPDFKDRYVNNIFEVLFKAISKERTSYVKATKTTVKNTASSRLSTYASALRSAIVILLQRLRLRTLRAFLGHVVQTLPVAEEGLCRPLCTDYLKALRTVLEYQPHVEHLSHEDWLSTVDFCLESLTALEEASSQSTSSMQDSLSTPRGSFMTSQRASMRTFSESSRANGASGRENLYTLIHCLAALVSASNCKLAPRFESICGSICGFLQASSSTTSAHVAAYTCLNRLLERIRLSRVTQTVEIIQEMIPSLQFAWSAKDSALRDQVLIFLILTEDLFWRMPSARTREDMTIHIQVQGLFDTLRTDYLEFDHRDRRKLSLDDVCLQSEEIWISQPGHGLASCHLKSCNVSAEHCWALLQVLGTLSAWLDFDQSLVRDQEPNSYRKRHRVSPRCIEDALHAVRKQHNSGQVYSLHILAFMMAHRSSAATEVSAVLEELVLLINAPEKTISCWAMIVLAECTMKPEFRAAIFDPTWLSIWHTAWKLMSSSSHCRPACHLLRLMLQNACISQESTAASFESLQNSASLYGPDQVCDASIALWRVILDLSRSSSSPIAISPDGCVEWFCSRWQPNNYENRSYAQQTAAHLTAGDVLLFVDSILGTGSHLQNPIPLESCGGIRQATLLVQKNKLLSSYLLGNHACPTWKQNQRPEAPSVKHSDASTQRLGQRILNFLLAESERLCESPPLLSDEPSTSTVLNAHMTQMIMSFSVASAVLSEHFLTSCMASAQRLKESLLVLVKHVSRQMSRPETPKALAEAALQAFLPVLPSLVSSVPIDEVCCFINALGGIATEVTASFTRRKETEIRDRGHRDSEDDEMESYGDSQSLRHEDSTSNGLPRTTLANETDFATVSQSTLAYLQLIASCSGRTAAEMEENRTTVPTFFVDFLFSLTLSELLETKPFLEMLVMSHWTIHDKDATRMLEHMMDTFLQEYDYERSEVSIDLCLQLMRGFLDLWTHHSDSRIAEYAADIYDWFSEKYAACSSTVQRSFSLLLFEMLPTPFEGKQSVRTALLQLLSECDLAVQFDMSARLPSMFKVYTLHNHEDFFNDVLESLPTNSESIEGIAVRLFALRNMASSWRTLLRLCVFHMFEAAAKVPDCLSYAESCFLEVAKSYNLSTTTALFEVFSSQLIYTWIDHASGSLATIPFQVFGFDNLKSLLVAISGEVTSQVYTGHGGLAFQEEISSGLSQSFVELTKSHFPKALAYALLQDAATKASARTSSHACENKIKESLGEASFKALLSKHFPDVIGHALSRLDNEDQVEKYLARSTDHQAAAIILRKINTISHSEQPMTIAQQPSFRARSFGQVISKLGRLLQANLKELWRPASLTKIIRHQLACLHPVLGSLHARRVIWRLKILVALVGDALFQLYPIQQIIHGIRPLLTDELCSADAIGLVQYLLDAGQPIMAQDLTFVLGTSIAIYLEVARFLASPKSPSTQESEHMTILSKLNVLRSWLDLHVCIYKTDSAEFRDMLMAAKKVRSAASPTVNSPEAELLIYLLREAQSDYGVMPLKLHNLNFEHLCFDFVCPESQRYDVFGNGKPATYHMAGLWLTSQRDNLHPAYYTWAAKSLGRAFAYSGRLTSEIGRETRMNRYQRQVGKAVDLANLRGHDASKAILISTLGEFLYASDHEFGGIAEATLRTIIVLMGSAEEKQYLSDCLSDPIVQALASQKDYNISTASSAGEAGLSSLREVWADKSFPSHASWAKQLCHCLVLCTTDPFLLALTTALKIISGFAETALPFILHLTIFSMVDAQGEVVREISQSAQRLLECRDTSLLPRKRSLLECLILLWNRAYPRERTRLDRANWLRLKTSSIIQAAEECRMFKSALYCLESELVVSPIAAVQRSEPMPSYPLSSLLSIYRQIDEPDSFYGVEQVPGFKSIADRMDYEDDAIGSLMLQGAHLDATIASDPTASRNFDQVMRSLTKMNLNSLTQQLVANGSASKSSLVIDSLAKSALKLQRWDITIPATSEANSSTSTFQTFQGLARSSNMNDLRLAIDTGVRDLLFIVKNQGVAQSASNRAAFAALSAVTGVGDMIESSNITLLQELISSQESNGAWMQTASINNVAPMLTVRETWHGMVATNSHLQQILHINPTTAQSQEINARLHSSAIYRSLGSFQHALSNVVYLGSKPAKLGSMDDGQVQRITLETAKVLWSRGELVPSIKMLQGLLDSTRHHPASGETSFPSILATLARWSSEARLERPADIMEKYLDPALSQLAGIKRGEDAGRVFHEFAAYCHKQLVNPDFVNEFRRSRRYRIKKNEEIKALDAIIKGRASENEKRNAKIDKHKAQKWMKLDTEEYSRLKDTRDQLMRQSLDNYLMSLSAWDKEDNDVLRFYALWLEYSTEHAANEVVGNAIDSVPVHKFVRLMNQISSRLQDLEEPFQAILSRLVESVCRCHPYHGMNFIFAGSKILGGNDRTARSRHAAATKIASRLRSDRQTTTKWTAIAQANDTYISVAALHFGPEVRPGAKLKLRNYSATRHLERDLPQLKVPPITMNIAVRQDKNYESVPHVVAFRDEMAIAGGLSAPKIITARASNGANYKQLYKSGSDDLRQDAIMEQVFEQVSTLLKAHKATKQRDLGIRTYKVIALNGNSGVIEFVNNTISFNDYLTDAHARYHPEDIKWIDARKCIDEASKHAKEQRIETYRQVAHAFKPVLRHFFFERCQDPDEWFDMRLSYTRSTAAISILGWILGLGDRHCQNILLDERTGEVVHIDLGVSFEAGRVLTIPEVVPFRLTRDVVDGFGITKTEGVFRRCCEFTLEALRANKDAIMTLLNVLRYDPLYNWSVSPLRARRLQTDQDRGIIAGPSPAGTAGMSARSTRSSGAERILLEDEAAIRAEAANDKRDDEEGGEADRALSVVGKKLAAGLSVEATVNELIQQATDEANLAVMFCGWSPYV